MELFNQALKLHKTLIEAISTAIAEQGDYSRLLIIIKKADKRLVRRAVSYGHKAGA